MYILVSNGTHYVRALPVIRGGRIVTCKHELTQDIERAIVFDMQSVAASYRDRYGLFETYVAPKRLAVWDKAA